MAATQPPPGSVSARLPVAEEIKEYEKILKISDDIFSGTHPRLKVPQQFVRKVASRNPPVSATQIQTRVSSGPSPKNSSKSVAPTAKSLGPQNANVMNGPPNTAAASRILPNPTSEIDPIFLTKSDDLVRAELQLQRQRVERVLREQLEQKKLDAKQKANPQDTNPDFDVSDVLAKAFELVKPTPSIDAPGAGAPSDSFDENSFYSSRAPDSPQQGDQQKQSSGAPSNPEELSTGAPPERYSDELQRLEALNRPESDQDMQDTYPTTDRRSAYQHRQPHLVEGPPRRTRETLQQTDPLEEPEYSPPAPGVAPMERIDGYEPTRGAPTAPKRRGPDRTRYSRRSMSPTDDVRVVRNHITSPAAPQPSRVSPLAITKVPSAHQPKDSRAGYGSEHPGSPEGPAQPVVARKRRRLHDDRDRSRPEPYRMQAGSGSSKPYIKEEPVSPPPFADTPPNFRARQPQERPVYIDIASPRYTPVIERREPPPVYELDPYDETHAEAGIPRTLSRLSTRRPMRDDQDLRRVISLYQPRGPEYAREYIDHHSPSSVHTGSHTIVERPPQKSTQFYTQIPIQGPPRIHEAFYGEEPRLIAPPHRRIVIDDQGNQYYEEVALPRAQPMPPPSSRIPRTDGYEEPPQMRQASVRAASVLEDPYNGRRYVQEMPPPQGAYRRVTADYTRPAPNEHRPYAAIPYVAREPFPRSSSVQVHDYGTRRALEEAEIPRERIVRMPSVRPPTTARYDEPREVIQRVESVRPGGRDVSVYMDDDARRPREYIERPVYVATHPLAREERYYESGDPERIVIDGARDTVHRVSQRY